MVRFVCAVLQVCLAGVAVPPARADARPADVSATPTILVSRQLAEQQHLRVGELVRVAADGKGSGAREFRIAGVYEPTPDPRRFSARRIEARLHLPDLLALTGDASDPRSSESAGAINLELRDPAQAGPVRREISARAPGLLVESTSQPDAANDPFAVIDRFHWAIAIVTVSGSTAFLLALMVMRAEERREVVGILRLLGIAPRSILIEVFFEGLLIAAAGAAFGVLVAVSAQDLVNRFFQWRYDTTLVFVRVTAGIVWKSVAFSVPLGVAAGVAASWTLLRRDVVSLLRR
jgi:putative ABC transport system permease protein